VPTIEISTITPLIFLAALSNQSNQSSQSNQIIVTRILVHTQSRNQGRSMVDEMGLPILEDMNLKIWTSICSYAKLYGALSKLPMKLSRELSSVLP
jgi:hypothetical protein